MSELDDRLDRRLGRKKKVAEALAAMGLHTVGDLLRRPPRRYMDLSVLSDLADVPVGEEVTVVAEVIRATSHRMQRRQGWLTEVVVADAEGRELFLAFFNQKWRERQLHPGYRGAFSGKVGAHLGKRQLTHPVVEVVDDDAKPTGTVELAATVTKTYDLPIPIYSLANDLKQKEARNAVWGILETLGSLPDPITPEIRDRHGLRGLRESLVDVHRPRTAAHHVQGLRRLMWEEAFVLQVELARRRTEARAQPAVPRNAVDGGLSTDFDARLPFELTDGQRSVGATIAADLASPHPMNRLLQGEVGTGKTVVALRAMLQVVDSGGQAALLAPTEVLAQQHLRSITAMLGPLADAGRLTGAEHATNVVLLTGSMAGVVRRAALDDARSGQAGIVVGTHALIQEDVEFDDLGLVVVDEQHRFGVEQRDRLRGKARSGRTPHLLVMTATPIPRTIAMTVFGDLDVSTLTDQPVGRAGVATQVVPADNERFMERTWERVREEVERGHQAFVVCPQISNDDGAADQDQPVDPFEEDDVGSDERRHEDSTRRRAAVLDLLPKLRAGPLSGLRIEMLHGRMDPEQKEDVMQRFGAGRIDVLVATTVVEVGVDIPNATAMVVLDAQQFGISQLHQLRGRVGRGPAPGICLLVTPVAKDTPSGERLQAVAATNDGFQLAENDLDQRREGDVLGRSQSGWRTSLRNLRVLRDRTLIADARTEATAIVDADPTLASHPELAAALDVLVERDRAEFLERG